MLYRTFATVILRMSCFFTRLRHVLHLFAYKKQTHLRNGSRLWYSFIRVHLLSHVHVCFKPTWASNFRRMDGIIRRLRYDTRVSVDRERTLSLTNRCMRCICSRRGMSFHVNIRFIHTETSFFRSLRCVYARIHFSFHGHIVCKHTLSRHLECMRYLFTL